MLKLRKVTIIDIKYSNEFHKYISRKEKAPKILVKKKKSFFLLIHQIPTPNL